ncbi:MAG: glutamine-hydrolyzing GMP synthase [Clostridiaceae bacterium]|nr:glutamine-hydrolyzing GMP synthase [Clostridiaceae bacterium]
MRHLNETILIVDAGGSLARTLVHAIRDREVYCELVSSRRFLEGDHGDQDQIRGLVVTGRAGEISDDLREKLNSVGTPVLVLDQESLDAGRNESLDRILAEFLFGTCGCQGNWTVDRYIDEMVAEIRGTVGGKKVICGLSGGVDSSVAAFLVHRAVGDQLTGVFVDHGFMRKDEPDMVRRMFSDQYQIPLVFVDATDRFLKEVEDVLDPEIKRKRIGETFIRVFESEARKIDASYLVQGTIYPDVIESGEDGQVVKSHHNVGGLPDRIHFEGIVEPLRFLFKEEVRAVGRALGLPPAMVDRQPFPGPGLAIRCLGGITREKLDMLRKADAIFREEIETKGYRDQASQYFAVMTGLQSVGVTDGARTYDYTIALRAVKTDDFMAALPVVFPWDFLQHVSMRITSEVPHVSRVVYELTGKPPATIEWE